MIQRHEEKESNYIGRNLYCEIIKMIDHQDRKN